MAIEASREAIDGGTAALQIGQYCPPGHSPPHVALEPVWTCRRRSGRARRAARRRSRAATSCRPTSSRTGVPPVPDFHGGDTNFKSVDYSRSRCPVMQTLNALVIDGVLQRHPRSARRRDRGRRVVDTELVAPARLRPRGVPQERGAAPEDGDAPERVRAPADPGDAVPARRRRVDDRERRCRGVHVLVRLPARRGRPQPDRPLRAQHGSRRHRRRNLAGASTGTTTSTCSAPSSNAAVFRRHVEFDVQSNCWSASNLSPRTIPSGRMWNSRISG